MPRIFYGWYIVAASLVIMTFGVGGGLYLFGALLPPLVSEFGWTHAELSGANSLAMIIMGVLGPVVGRLIDRHDGRVLMSIAAVGCGLGFGAQALIGTLPAVSRVVPPLVQLYACYAVYGAGLSGIGYVPLNTIISRWFSVRRGVALGIVAVGTGFGGFLPIPAGWLIDHAGWRLATAAIGAAITGIIVPLVVLFIRLRPEDLGLMADDRVVRAPEFATSAVDARAARSAPPARTILASNTFLALAAAFVVYTITVTIVRVFGIALLQENGLPPLQARFVMGALAFWSILGKVAFGALTDRFSPRAVATSAFVLAAIGTAFLVGPAGDVSAALFAVVYGFPMGGIAALQPVIIARYFAPTSFGSTYGTLVMLLTFGAAAGPVIAGGVYDMGGGYQPTLLVCSVASGAAAFLIVAAKPYAVRAPSGAAVNEA